VCDATVEQALAAVKQARQAAMLQLALADGGWTEISRPSTWPTARVDRVLDRPASELALEAHPEFGARYPQTTSQLVRATGDRAPLLAQLSRWLALPLVLLGPLFAMVGFSESVVGVGVSGLVATALGLLAFMPMRRSANRVARIRDQGSRTRAKLTGLEPASSYMVDNERVRLVWLFEHPVGTPRTGRSAPMQRRRAQQWLERGWVVVYYDPEHPDESWWEDDVGRRSDA
jgi:hypothetical protein